MMERRIAPPENPFATDRIVGLADFGVHGHTRCFEVHIVVFLGKINGGLNIDAVSMSHVDHHDPYFWKIFRKLNDAVGKGKRWMPRMDEYGQIHLLRHFHQRMHHGVISRKGIEKRMQLNPLKTVLTDFADDRFDGLVPFVGIG